MYYFIKYCFSKTPLIFPVLFRAMQLGQLALISEFQFINVKQGSTIGCAQLDHILLRNLNFWAMEIFWGVMGGASTLNTVGIVLCTIIKCLSLSYVVWMYCTARKVLVVLLMLRQNTYTYWLCIVRAYRLMMFPLQGKVQCMHDK